MDVLLSLNCQTEKGLLHVHYTLTNQGKVPILAYDGAPGKPAGAPWPDARDQVYTSVLGDTLAIKRVNPPPLPGRTMEMAFLPPLSETQPGEQREVQFTLAEPVAERSQYTPDFAGAVYRDGLVRSIQLQLGYFARTEAMQLVPFPANPKAFRLKGAHGPESFAVASAIHTVPVKQRVDASFQRT